jgi:hypothetical protein
MDVQVVLASVDERDKWRRRLEILQNSLKEVRERERWAVARLRRLRRDLLRLQRLSESMGSIAGYLVPPGDRSHAQTHPRIPSR